jgi:RNA polymerase sigma-70 factor, ECF subfamily
MPTDPSFPLVIARLRAGDPDAASEIFRRFVHRLIALASREFDARVRSKEDPEDVVLSVLKSFFVRDGRSPFDLSDWDGLWALLATITVRKCILRRRFWNASRRNPAREVGLTNPSAGRDCQEEWREVIASGPTSEQAAVLAETLELLVSRLDEHQREIALLYFEGLSHYEISERLDCSERTVGRVVGSLRERLRELEAEDLEG